MNQDKTLRQEGRKSIKYHRFVNGLYWAFALFLVLMNVIPLGKANVVLNRERFIFRLDYLAHAAIMLGFAGIYLLAKCLKTQIFMSREKSKLIALTFLFALLLEPLQLLVPWRTFNPLDLAANLVGAALVSVIVLLVR